MEQAIFGLIGVALGVGLSELAQLRRERRDERRRREDVDMRMRAAARVIHTDLHLAAISVETALHLSAWPDHGPRWADPRDWAEHLAILAERLSTDEWRKIIAAHAGLESAHRITEHLQGAGTGVTDRDAWQGMGNALDALQEAEAVLERYALTGS